MKTTTFTFGVLTYQQEHLVVQTLESIKYQIQTYAAGISCRLIVVDDCSADRTAQKIHIWLADNEDLFAETQVVVNEINRGTVCNYNYIMERIGDENFKIMAGDDLISSGNLFACYDGLDDGHLFSYLRMELIDDVICYDEERLALYYYNSRRRKHHLARLRQGGYLHTPSTLYTKGLYEGANCAEQNRQFRLFEDDPTWYAMLKNTPDLDIQFFDKLVVLYRMHQRSVSNAKRTKKNAFDYEMDQLHAIYGREAKGFSRLYWMLKNQTKLPKYLNLSKYYDYLQRRWKVFVARRDADYQKFQRQVDAMVEREQKYYNQIQKRAAEFE